jgi:hypothetical protein
VKKRKGLLASVIFAVVVIADVFLFGPQIFATVWEARTGFHRDLHGIRFHVPLFYVSSDSTAYGQYDFATTPSPTRKKYAFITVDFQKQASEAPPRPMTTSALERLHERLTGQRTATLAGKSGTCFEYADEKNVVTIECYFDGGPRTWFMGTPNTLEDFYTFMNRAETMSKTN